MCVIDQTICPYPHYQSYLNIFQHNLGPKDKEKTCANLLDIFKMMNMSRKNEYGYRSKPSGFYIRPDWLSYPFGTHSDEYSSEAAMGLHQMRTYWQSGGEVSSANGVKWVLPHQIQSMCGEPSWAALSFPVQTKVSIYRFLIQSFERTTVSV